jgi:taurine-pyruvate aminotransferase
VDGKGYLEGMSGLWCVNVGHGRTAIAEKAYEQMKTVAYSLPTQSHEPVIRLVEKINEWLDGEYCIFFSNSGSDANEVAFKIVRQYYHQKGESMRLFPGIELIMEIRWVHLEQPDKQAGR